MDINERVARIIGFLHIQIAEKDAMIEQLQAKIQALEAGYPHNKDEISEQLNARLQQPEASA